MNQDAHVLDYMEFSNLLSFYTHIDEKRIIEYVREDRQRMTFLECTFIGWGKI